MKQDLLAHKAYRNRPSGNRGKKKNKTQFKETE